MNIGVIIQARSSSSRLPRKVLKPLPFDSDICVLQQVIRRVSKSKLIDNVIVATSTNEEDNEIVEVAKKENIPYYRGSLENVLERYYNAAKLNDLDISGSVILSDSSSYQKFYINKALIQKFSE